MRAITEERLREDLEIEIRRCRDNAEAVLIVSPDETENAVLMSLGDYEAIIETIRIYQNPELHKKILRGIRQIAPDAC